MKTNNKAAILNLGCKVNAYEASAMEEALKNNGYTIVPFEERADVYVINTCTVTAIADKKSRQMIRRAKNQNESALVIACGCYVQNEDVKSVEGCDIILGNDKKFDIINVIESYQSFSKSKNSDEIYNCKDDLLQDYKDISVNTSKDKTRAYVKIQDGCNHFCTYCIIPYVRGRSRSRDISSVVKECKALAENGYKEIVFCGVNLSDYHFEKNGLIDVIEAVDSIDKIERIRLGSIEPDIFTYDFVKRLRDCKKVCSHFHFSLQSACDKTLKTMNRRYGFLQVKSAVDTIRSFYENPAICADVIAGFPGETKEDFKETYNNIDSLDFFQLHVFPYSKRKGTKAYDYPQLEKKEKQQRAKELIDLSLQKEKAYMESFLGKELRVLFEEIKVIDGKDYWVGHCGEYIKCAYKSDKNIRGDIIKVLAVDFLDKDTLFVKNI